MSQLFKKGSSSANEMAEIWDDTALIRMYEESISSAYNSVAAGACGSKKKAKAPVKQWSVGDRCAAPYTEDGQQLWFPATIAGLDSSSGTVEVCFDGYEGTETVAMQDLCPEEQFLEYSEGAKQEYASEGEEEEMDVSSAAASAARAAATAASASFHAAASSPSAAAAAAAASRKRTNGGKGAKQEQGGFRAPIPSLAPPPPPSFTALPRPNEDDALSSMLMSWYMSGYHTGYYQAMQDFKAGKK